VALNLRAAMGEARGKYIAVLNDDDAWEPEFLEKVVAPLEQSSPRALSFSDHWIMTEDGQLDPRWTDENTVRYGRSTLPAGEVENLEDFVLKKNGVPLAMASVFRRDAIDLELLVKDVGGAYDLWISCLLAASGRSAYYVPERLTRYRSHKNMETGRMAPDKSEDVVFIFRKLMDMKAFPGKESLLKVRYSQALYRSGRDRLLFNRVKEARSFFRRSLSAAMNAKAAVSYFLSWLPGPLRVALKLTIGTRATI
jgi:glycosyl transferase family 2